MAARQKKRAAPRKRVRDPEGTRKALIEAAAEVFNEDGFHGTDSNQIARRAGYAPGSFYTHFADKTEIFLAVYDQWVRSEWLALEAALQSGATGAGLHAKLVKEVLDHHRRWRVFRASLRALTATDERVHAARIEQRRRQVERYGQLIASRPGRRGGMPSPARMWSALLTFEVLCDGISEGDAKALGIPEGEVVAYLTEVLGGVMG